MTRVKLVCGRVIVFPGQNLHPDTARRRAEIFHDVGCRYCGRGNS